MKPMTLAFFREVKHRRRGNCDFENGAVIDAIREALKDREQYLKTFEHTHVAGRDGDIDSCHQCGLDIRDEIHTRIEVPKK